MTSQDLLILKYEEKILNMEEQHKWLVTDSMKQLYDKDVQITELVQETTMLRNVITELKAEILTIMETSKFLNNKV